MALERVDAYLEKHRSHFEEQLKDLIRIPSVSAQPDHDADTRRAAEFVRDDLAAMGLHAELIATKRHPIVYAEWLRSAGQADRSWSTATTTCSRPSRWSRGSLPRSSRRSATATSTPAAPPTTRARCSPT